MDEAVHAHQLRRSFGAITAVDGVSLGVPAGSVFGLLGPDGAGKSTLMRLLATVTVPDSGDAEVFGASVTRQPGRVTPRIGYMSQQFGMYPDLSVQENLDFFATLRGVSAADRRTRSQRLLTSMGMDQFTKRPAGKLSGGMKQKLMLASTLMHEPDLLLLDEPTTGVDPVSRREFWSILAELPALGKTVFVATPYMDEAERCTDVAFIDAGQITRTGTPDQIRDQLPGVLLEIAAERPREVLATLAPDPHVMSAHLLADRVRVLWSGSAQDPGEAVTTVREELAAHGLTSSVTAIRPDMEAAFAYLAGSPS